MRGRGLRVPIQKDVKKEYEKVKQKLLKLYPGAFTKVVEKEINGKQKQFFYVVDGAGFRILREENQIPESSTVYEAWKNTLNGVWLRNIVIRNNEKFSDDKILKSLIKEQGGE